MNCLNSYGYDVAQHNLVSIKRRIDAKLNSCKAECDSCGDDAFKLKMITYPDFYGYPTELTNQLARDWFYDNVTEENYQIFYDLWSSGELYIEFRYEEATLITNNPLCVLKAYFAREADAETGDYRFVIGRTSNLENNSDYSSDELIEQYVVLLNAFLRYSFDNGFYDELTPHESGATKSQ